jgi:hypothetical protein
MAHPQYAKKTVLCGLHLNDSSISSRRQTEIGSRFNVTGALRSVPRRLCTESSRQASCIIGGRAYGFCGGGPHEDLMKHWIRYINNWTISLKLDRCLHLIKACRSQRLLIALCPIHSSRRIHQHAAASTWKTPWTSIEGLGPWYHFSI